MMWRLFLVLLVGYLGFSAYNYYWHSQPITASDIRQNHLLKSDELDLALVWPEDEDKAGYIKAVRLVVEAINADGLGRCKILQHQVQVRENSNQCTAKVLKLKNYIEATDRIAATKQAKAIASSLNTVAALGYYRSVAAVPAAPVYEFEGVLMLSSGSTNVQLTNYDFKHIFRNAANDDSNAAILANRIHSEGYINAYVLYDLSLYGTGFSNYFIEHASELGLRVPAPTVFPEHNTDFLPILSLLRSEISPVNLTDEIALLQAKLQATKRIFEIARLSVIGDDESIIQFLTLKHNTKSSNNRFFGSMSSTKLQDYLQQALAQTASVSYLEDLYLKNQKELSLLTDAEHYEEIEQLSTELQGWIDKVKSMKDPGASSTSEMLANERLIIRTVIDLDADDVLLKLEQMQKRISRIKTGETDIIFIAGFMPDIALAISQARGLDIDLPFYGGGPLNELKNSCRARDNCASYGEVYSLVTHDVDEYRRAYKATLKGAKVEEFCADGDDDCLPERYACPHFKTAYTRYQGFAESYQKRYGIQPDNWAIQGYLAASMIQETLNSTDTFEPEVIADTLLYKGNREFADRGLMFSCNSHGITEGDILVEEMKIRRL